MEDEGGNGGGGERGTPITGGVINHNHTGSRMINDRVGPQGSLVMANRLGSGGGDEDTVGFEGSGPRGKWETMNKRLKGLDLYL